MSRLGAIKGCLSPVVQEVDWDVERLGVQQAVRPVEPCVMQVVQRHYGGSHIGYLREGGRVRMSHLRASVSGWGWV